VTPPAPRRALWALREGWRRPRQKARRPGGSARGVRGQGRELPGPRHGCNGRQGAMGDAGGRREGPRTTPGPKGRFAASSGRRPVPRGLPRAALTFRVPGAARPRRAPRAASRSARQPGLTHPVSSETTLYTNLPLSLFFMPQRTPSFSAEPRFGVQHGLPPCLCDYFLPPSHYFLRLAPFVCV